MTYSKKKNMANIKTERKLYYILLWCNIIRLYVSNIKTFVN